MASKYTKKLHIIICKNCNNEFRGRTNQVFCSKVCFKQTQLDKRHGSAMIGIAPATVGAIAELMVSTDLMRKGYHVYRALSNSCFADLIAMKGDELLQYEVRTGTYYHKSDGTKRINYPNNKIAGKRVAIVTHTDGVIHYLD